MCMTVEAEGQRRIDGIIKAPISGSLLSPVLPSVKAGPMEVQIALSEGSGEA